MKYDYSDIKYYNDLDFRRFLPELVQEPLMYRIVKYYHPAYDDNQAREFLQQFTSVDDFQKGFIIHLMEKIIHDSVTDLTYDGVENIDPSKKYLFITNHRNIVMDVSTLNYVLYKEQKEKFQSTAIAIGNNLLKIPWVMHLARMNKSFLVERDLIPQQLLLSSKRLSQYIRDIITSKSDSIWLANREGRTKDGNDFSQAGLIKMLNMSGESTFADNFSELHIIPVAISYEKDPCDLMKINELAAIENGIKYVKSPMEDFNSMIAGLTGSKGRMHYQFGKELSRDVLLKINEHSPVNQKVRNLCNYLDKFIFANYRLYESNYIAADILNNESCFSHLYKKEQYVEFIIDMEEKLKSTEGDDAQNRIIYLKMMANPVKNYYSVVDSDYKFNF